MVYCDQDMCESKLGRLMQAFRADRPDEWSMDEFIGMAEQMHKEIEALRQSEKDAARYRWLRDTAHTVTGLTQCAFVMMDGELMEDWNGQYGLLCLGALDAAVDEAMSVNQA